MDITFNSINVDNYNLDTTLNSGQVFCWTNNNGIWFGATVDGLIILKQSKPNEILWQTYPQSDNFTLLHRYLRLDFDFGKFIDSAQNDSYLSIALTKFPGLRLVSQNTYEAIISFVVSAFKNIPAIKQSIQILSRMYGEKVNVNGNTYHLFPKLERIAEAKIEDLRKSKIGYRAEYISATAKNILYNNISFIDQSESETRKTLLSLKGIGNKVADCVMCYSLGFDNVTPLDVWGQRVLTKYYKLEEKMSYSKMREWTQSKFTEYTAWAGQYLFELVRKSKDDLNNIYH